MKTGNTIRQDVLAWSIIAGLLTAITIFSVLFLKVRDEALVSSDDGTARAVQTTVQLPDKHSQI